MVYQAFVPVYTDGSKDPNTRRTGFAFSIPSLNISVNRRISDNLSVYTVQMMAIATSLQWIEETQIKKVLICTDSCSLFTLMCQASWRDELCTHLQLDRYVQTGHLNTKTIGHLSFLINVCLLPESACIVAAILKE